MRAAWTGARAGGGADFYVVNGADASVSLVDPGSGRGLGAVPVPAGTQLVVPGRVEGATRGS